MRSTSLCLHKTSILFTKMVITFERSKKLKIPRQCLLAWLSGKVLSKLQRKTFKSDRKRTQNVRFTRWSFRFEIWRKIYYGAFFRCNEITRSLTTKDHIEPLDMEKGEMLRVTTKQNTTLSMCLSIIRIWTKFSVIEKPSILDTCWRVGRRSKPRFPH